MLRSRHRKAVQQIFLEHSKVIEEVKEMSKVGPLVASVYAAGGRLAVLEYAGKNYVIAEDGEIPDGLHEAIQAVQEELLEALTGDPLQGPGWEARTALYRQALKYLDKVVEDRGLDQDAAVEALCRRRVDTRLGEAWRGGDFEKFREALKEYIQTGLDAARGKKTGTKLEAGAA